MADRGVFNQTFSSWMCWRRGGSMLSREEQLKKGSVEVILLLIFTLMLMLMFMLMLMLILIIMLVLPQHQHLHQHGHHHQYPHHCPCPSCLHQPHNMQVSYIKCPVVILCLKPNEWN